MYGKTLRLARLFGPTGKTCIVPMDHGVTYGPIKGIENYCNTAREVLAGEPNAIVVHKGLLKSIASNKELAIGRFIMHLSASTILSNDTSNKVIVGSVEEAIQLGADAISLHINLECDLEPSMLQSMGQVSKLCLNWGMPLLAMMYTCNNPNKVTPIAHAARIAEELGADIIKLHYPGSREDVGKIINGVNVPVIFAGGEYTTSTEKLVSMVNDTISGGASGVAIGRNIFQHKNPRLITKMITKLVHGEIDYKECIMNLKGEE
ncbi:2-amino-3,7-dideoxy-D-threo-hept-6-ulosonate synthase [Paenibacillus apiarius]|uniref:2-amino-3,7-dideoxy-D-threo-hept-6-ulosonate synthase n=1 Tax=Paenibacillus apiarius TaxID=46240 RepID=A0ABT4DR07_9BACL|nr:2-amino-3,7-dideoxy-D-threo-hept-6-ulosonate synthase [Paenibacillus apiarius]MCY9512515.1 2-amino-3,7-dideoxy-D-threo-hept-6-ulosonate synthase [Paenibacillus apiarius]MCY9519786.1 2-amino-3,7-dideoxy-D-threo-hept-6-ulosonate synthase [Paenibacillus apiarius]MCY9553103.1 2-amino-3,7-dideoxy-D-threo-hept-6-ulosonate synthase [Paenibacillus apiarius]MCY9559329.1 2-amino-3,7-dideoxy-D-threo-hept-6-ulosonate synthase [Paenibacillus apiarius]MCY9682688.1 2-amino-3,7-dideoxy-D-threo-hept-6-uloso